MATVEPLRDDELQILGALAEALIPEDDTPGADASWAIAFLHRHLRAHPEERPAFSALAAHVDRLARTEHGHGFEALPVATREALLLARHPSLADEAALAADERTLRAAMRDLVAGFLVGDAFDIHADPYQLRGDGPRRDPRTASSAEFSTADRLPDRVLDRRIATWSGTGTYARVWRAAGYVPPPGVPKDHPEDVTVAPDPLVELRRPPPAKK